MSVPRHIEHHSTRDSWNNLPTAPAVIASRCFGDCCGGNSPAKRERHCCMLREPTVVSQNYVGRLKFIVVFMGTLLLMHKEMDKCWNTHPGKTNHLGQNHGGMIVAFIPCHSDPLLYLRNLRHRHQGSWKAIEHYTSWYYGWGIPNGYPGEVEKSFRIICISHQDPESLGYTVR